MPQSDLFWIPSPAPTDGVVGDINTMRIDPSHLGNGQDVIVDSNGVLRSRGAFVSYTSDALTNTHWLGLAELSAGLPAGTTNPAACAVLYNDSDGNTYLYGSTAKALTGFAKLTVRSPRGTTANQTVSESNILMSPSMAKLKDDLGAVMCFNHINGGQVDSWSFPLLWGGNATTTSDTAAGTAASTIGSRGITGVGTAWTTALEGTYLFIGGIASTRSYVGQVRQVQSTTTLTLYKGALCTIAANIPNFKTAREPVARVYKGRITTNTASAVVVGSNTKWANSGPGGSGATYLTTSVGATVFRYSDGAYIGKIASVQNDTTLTLTGNAAIAMVNDEYYIVINDGVTFTVATGDNFGAFSASCVELFSDRYWYGCIAAQDQFIKGNSFYYNSVTIAPMVGTNSIMFSKKGDPEMLDMSPVDGDIIRIPTGEQPDMVRALVATRGGLVVFRLYDTFLLTGYSPETFRLVKLVDDGAWSNASAKPYKDGVVWCGTKSCYYFDGTRIVDLFKDKVKRFYRRTNYMDSNALPQALSVSNDHVIFSYFLKSTANRTWPYKNTTKTLQLITPVINMLNGAVTFFTNAYVTGGIIDSTGNELILMYDKLIDGSKVFEESTTGANNFDAVTCSLATFTSGTAIGPDVMFETTKLNAGDSSLMKFWKRFMMDYSSDVSMTASVLSVNNTDLDFPNLSTGTASADVFAASSGISVLKRIRFIARAPAIAIRVYQTNTTSATSQRFKLLWWSVAGKVMRRGRPQ